MLKKSHSIYLYVYYSHKRPELLLDGLDTGVTSHTLDSKRDQRQAAFVCHDCSA